MKKWTDYKKTFPKPSLFDFARSGDLTGLAELLALDPHLDVNQKNHKGYCALMLAIYNGQDIFAQALLRGGADVNSTDLVGNSVLMGAAYKGNTALIKLLLDWGADAKAVNESGMNAYDWAKTFGRKEAMELLATGSGSEKKPSSLFKNYINFARLALKIISKR